MMLFIKPAIWHYKVTSLFYDPEFMTALVNPPKAGMSVNLCESSVNDGLF